jgi:hypothetical protein
VLIGILSYVRLLLFQQPDNTHGISRPPSISVATNGWAIADRFPGGRPLRRRREMVLVYGHQRLRGTAALQVADHRCYDRMAIVGRSSGGRPLRRHRERVQAIARDPIDSESETVRRRARTSRIHGHPGEAPWLSGREAVSISGNRPEY